MPDGLRSLEELIDEVSALTGAAPSNAAPVVVSGDRRILPSCFDVTGFATAAAAVAAQGVAAVLAVRTSQAPAVRVDTRAAAGSFVCEQLLTPLGWELPPVWDAVAGDYRGADGWIRLHTNYSSHRAAALVALGLPADATREQVAAVVVTMPVEVVETSVVEAGGCAAAMHRRESWLATDHGIATEHEPPIRVHLHDRERRHLPNDPTRPLDGVNVLDLTRVIAGPVCTRYLAAHGASVLRLDPPGFAEVPALVPETTVGKRTAWLDLRDRAQHGRFLELVADADVVVHGLRPGAMEALALGSAELRSVNPDLVLARLDTYGWQGPWSQRRGFDSLVQMSCGIAAAGMAAVGADRPTPLPAQALDHGAGHLLAAAIGHALAAGRPADIHASLLGVANLLWTLPDPEGMSTEAPTWTDADRELRSTGWGDAMAAPVAGSIDGHPAELAPRAGALGRHRPTFASL